MKLYQAPLTLWLQYTPKVKDSQGQSLIKSISYISQFQN